MSLATVYNNLHEFCRCGLLRHVATHGKQAIFDTNAEPHHHVIDRRTCKIRDVTGVNCSVPNSALRPGERVVAVEIAVTVDAE